MKQSSHLRTIHRGSRLLAWFCLLVAGIAWVLAGGMTQAGRLAEENAQFV
jgi:hypothetical protein